MGEPSIKPLQKRNDVHDQPAKEIGGRLTGPWWACSLKGHVWNVSDTVNPEHLVSQCAEHAKTDDLFVFWYWLSVRNLRRVFWFILVVLIYRSLAVTWGLWWGMLGISLAPQGENIKPRCTAKDVSPPFLGSQLALPRVIHVRAENGGNSTGASWLQIRGMRWASCGLETWGWQLGPTHDTSWIDKNKKLLQNAVLKIVGSPYDAPFFGLFAMVPSEAVRMAGPPC